MSIYNVLMYMYINKFIVVRSIPFWFLFAFNLFVNKSKLQIYYKLNAAYMNGCQNKYRAFLPYFYIKPAK